MALFESYERRIDKINSVLNSYGIASIEEAEKITKDAGLDVYAQVKSIQPICFENACWASTGRERTPTFIPPASIPTSIRRETGERRNVSTVNFERS